MSTTTTQPLSVTCAEAARLVGLSKSSLLKYVKRGEIPASRPGKTTLILVDDLRAWLNRNRVEVANG